MILDFKDKGQVKNGDGVGSVFRRLEPPIDIEPEPRPLPLRHLFHYGRCATILSGPPEPPSIFIGSATMVLPIAGSALMSATFSNAGILFVISFTWAAKSFDWP